MPGFDLIVIGGGINGAGIARDAALRGLRTVLLEQGDLGSGTTRWSSRLIHGGLRYLEHGELGLVHESLAERERLLNQAGHLVRPLPLVIPVYAHTHRGLTTIDLGLWVYDMLSAGRSLPGHRRLDREAVLAQVPGLAREGLAGGALYYDAQVSFPERLVVENALAAREAGAEIRTYARVEALLRDGPRVVGVRVRNMLDGAGDTLEGRVIVNAAGPWIDRVLQGLDRAMPRYLGPTKGTHLVVPAWPEAPRLACYLEARADGRPFFIMPWNRLMLIGTTDIRFEGDPGTAVPDEDELSYLLTETHHAFPESTLRREDVHYHYTGVRPLPRQGPRQTAAITRRHVVRHHAPYARNLYSAIGGKLTTYRRLAEDVVDRVAPTLGARGADCLTGERPLPGSVPDLALLAADLARSSGLSGAVCDHLVSVYGARARAVARLALTAPELAAEICPFTHAIGAEVVFAFREELARTLADCLMRRCMAGLAPDLGQAALTQALEIAARHLGWDAARQASERARFLAEIAPLRTLL